MEAESYSETPDNDCNIIHRHNIHNHRRTVLITLELAHEFCYSYWQDKVSRFTHAYVVVRRVCKSAVLPMSSIPLWWAEVIHVSVLCYMYRLLVDSMRPLSLSLWFRRFDCDNRWLPSFAALYPQSHVTAKFVGCRLLQWSCSCLG
jgi:hypothetical protein